MLQFHESRPLIRGVLIGLAIVLPARAEVPDLLDPMISGALQTLEEEEYASDLEWWAADERGGREPGTPGSRAAAAFAAEQFQRLGLRPVGDAQGDAGKPDGRLSFYQVLDRGGKRGLEPGSRLAVGGKEFVPGEDWSLLGGCSEADLEQVGVVFAGYGITAPEYGYDDYEGVDVEGKAVLMFRYEPQEKVDDSDWKGASNTGHAFFRTKLENARKHGAVAVLFVNGPLHHDPATDPLSGLETVAASGSKVPMVHIRRTVVDALLESMDATLDELQREIDRVARPASRELPGVHVDLSVKVAELVKARNVMGLLEGSDPVLKDEIVVVGGHYDHVGRGDYGSRSPQRRGEVHNGADDNASGSVGVLEIAEALVQGGIRPRRSILFQLYDAEEKGLLGSRHYVEHPAVPLEKTVAMVNLDMIGRVKDGRLSIMGTGTAEEWDGILAAAEQGSPLEFRHRADGRGGSDQASFLRKEIPVLFFNSGMHPDYHTPDDDAERCNAEGAVEILKVVLKIVVLVADREERLTFREVPSERRQRRALLGIQVGGEPEGGGGVVIAGTSEGGGAAQAGLRTGDVILSIDGKSMRTAADLIETILEHEPGDVVKVRYRRGDKEREVEVTLGRG